MSITKIERKRQAKKKTKEIKKRKAANIRRNARPRKFRLDVELDGVWHNEVMKFRDAEQVEVYRSRTEAKRRAGEVISPGRVVNVDTGKIVLVIPGSKSKGELPDTITDGVVADPNVTAMPQENPCEVVINSPVYLGTGEKK